MTLLLIWQGSASHTGANNQPNARGLHPQTQSKENLARAELRARLVENFKPGRALLERKGVPFEPEELLDEGWQKRLAPKFDEMPEMRVTRKLGRRIKGVQLGDTLYLPENVELSGDLFILARKVIFEGRHGVIKGNFNVYFFPAETDGVLGTTLEVAVREQGVRFTKAGFSASRAAALKRLTPRLLQKDWSITIDTSGRGYKEWLEEQKRKTQVGFKKISSQGETINNNGGPGSLGPPGQTGETGSSGVPNPAPKGDDGVCGSVHGLSGFPGAPGGTGVVGVIGGKESKGKTQVQSWPTSAPRQGITSTSLMVETGDREDKADKGGRVASGRPEGEVATELIAVVMKGAPVTAAPAAPPGEAAKEA